MAWVQIDSRSGLTRVVSRPDWPVDNGTVLAQAKEHAPKKRRVLIAVREYQDDLLSYLAEHGCELVARHALLSRSLVVRIAEPRLVPARARAH